MFVFPRAFLSSRSALRVEICIFIEWRIVEVKNTVARGSGELDIVEFFPHFFCFVEFCRFCFFFFYFYEMKNFLTRNRVPMLFLCAITNFILLRRVCFLFLFFKSTVKKIFQRCITLRQVARRFFSPCFFFVFVFRTKFRFPYRSISCSETTGFLRLSNSTV